MAEEKKDYQRALILFCFLFITVLVWFSVNSVWQPKTDNSKNKKVDQLEFATPLVFSPGPDLQAQAYLVKIIGQDRPMLNRRSWKSLPPASLTKILTAVLAEEILLPEDKIIFSEE